MRPPPLFLAACAALWGIETGHWIVAGLLAALVESHRVVKVRWDLSTEDMRKLATISNVILVLVYIYFGITGPGRTHLPNVLQWWPVVLLPLILPAQYSTHGNVSPAALFMVLKKQVEREGRQPRRIYLDYPYAAVLVIAAGAANTRDPVYYTVLLVLAGWALWTVRSPRHHPSTWAGVFLLVSGVGFAAHQGLNNFQHWVVDAAVDFISGTDTDPYRHTTDLGHIGTLKLSDEILMRVDPGEGIRMPLLLHRASYNDYVDKTWVARGAPLQPVEAASNDGLFEFSSGEPPEQSISIATHSDEGIEVLALPTGTARLDNPTVITLQKNRLGTVRTVGDAGFMKYRVRVAPEALLPQPPEERDLKVPESLTKLLKGLVQELGLRDQPPERSIETVERFFSDGFSYSLYQEGALFRSPLEDFLTRSRSGHCEYFATATTLLLRAAGIPALYATGFSVQEYSELEERYLVRVRHAHAWTRAFVGDRWVDVDTTPPAWFAVEQETASPLQPIADWFSWLWHRYTVWNQQSDDASKQWILLLAFPVIGYLLWRMRGPRKKSSRGIEGEQSAPERAWRGLNSELLQIEARLRAEGLGRNSGETTAAWVRRLCRADSRFQDLQPIVALHYQQRFSSKPMSPGQRTRLTKLAESWLMQYSLQG